MVSALAMPRAPTAIVTRPSTVWRPDIIRRKPHTMPMPARTLKVAITASLIEDTPRGSAPWACASPAATRVSTSAVNTSRAVLAGLGGNCSIGFSKGGGDDGDDRGAVRR